MDAEPGIEPQNSRCLDLEKPRCEKISRVRGGSEKRVAFFQSRGLPYRGNFRKLAGLPLMEKFSQGCTRVIGARRRAMPLKRARAARKWRRLADFSAILRKCRLCEFLTNEIRENFSGCIFTLLHCKKCGSFEFLAVKIMTIFRACRTERL